MDTTDRILVVDDEDVVATTLKDVLQRDGYDVSTARSGTEAIELLKRHAFDVVVTDLMMEEGDGLHLIRRLSELSPQTVVVILTAHGTVDTAVEALRLGAYDYILKPCNNAYLKATIKRGLEKKRLIQQLRVRTEQLERSSAELARKSDQLSLLHEISASLQGIHSQEHLLNHVALSIHSRLGFPRVCIGLVSEDGRYVQWDGVAGVPAACNEGVRNRKTPLCKILEAMNHSETISRSYYIENDVPHHSTCTVRPSAGQGDEQTRTAIWCFDGALIIPLFSGGEAMIGVLVVEVFEGGHAPAQGTVEILETFAHTAAVALERVEIEKKLAKIYDVNIDMSLAATVDHIVTIVLEAMANILKFDHCSVNLFDRKRRILSTVACLGFPESELGHQFPVDSGEGVCAGVARTGEVANISDVREDPRYVMGSPDTKSELAVPVKMKSRVYGVLNVESDRLGAFSDKDVRPLIALASHAAVAIEHSRLEERLSALYTLNQEMSLAKSLDDLLEVVLDGAQNILEFDHCAIMFVDEETEELYVKTFRGFQKGIEHLRLPLSGGRGITVHAAETGKPVYVPDVSQEKTYVCGWVGTKSELAVPLTIGEKVIGVFNVESCEEDAFDDNDRKLFVTLASQTAAAIESTKLLDEVRKTKNYLENLVESCIDAIITTDVRGRITFFSSGAENIFGYTSQESLLQPVSTYYVRGRHEAQRVMELLLSRGKIQNHETEFHAKDGRIVSVSLSASLLRNEQGEVIGTVGISKDITEVKRLEKQMKETKNYLENLIEHSQDALFAMDLNGIITMWNRGAEHLYGYAKREAIGRCGDDLLDPKDHVRKTKDIVDKVKAFGSLVDEEVVRIRRDGRSVPVTATFSPILNADGHMTGISVIDKDISQRKRLETALRRSNARLKELSQSDDLTLLYNRRYLNQWLEEEIKRCKRFDRPMAFVMLDIDHFKKYNDTHGHPMGDRVLKQLAVLVLRHCREIDFVARYGGEEISIILPETDGLKATEQAERIRQLVEECHFEGEQSQPQGKLTISLGVAVYPEDAQNKEELVECADRALYMAKATGRNCVKRFFRPHEAPLSHRADESAVARER